MKRNVIALLLVLCLILGGCASTQFSAVDNSTKGTTIGEASVPESTDETEDFTTPGNDESSLGTSESAETDISDTESTESTETSESNETKPPVTSDEPETSKATETKPPQTEVPEKTDPPAETTKPPETTEPPTMSKEPETTTPPESTSTPETTEPPEETTSPTETTDPPETDPPVTTSPYDYPFDPTAIRRECISIAAWYGLVLDETLTPDNSCWANPDQATPNTQGTRLKRMLAETIEYYSKDYREANGIYPYEIRCYNIYLEDMGDGTYRIYFLYMM